MHWSSRLLASIAALTLVGGSAAVVRAAPPAASAAPAAKAAPDTDKPAAEDTDQTRRRHDLDANTCLTCHLSLPDKKLRTVAEDYARSVHRDDRIGCVACHKGNPTDPTVQAHDRANGFVVRPTHAEIADICGGCHEDPIFVRRFSARLPIDQRKLYELSRHGKLAAAGDENAPTCNNCHGTHEILHVVSPNAPVNRNRVVDLCAKCHADRKFMAPYELATDQVAKWKKSSHGNAFVEGNPKAPTCTGCHSPHAGKLPGSVAVAALCDRCHQDQRELFLQSPHAKAFRRLGLPECVPCHGDHGVSHESWLGSMSPDSACSRCHSKDKEPKRVAEEIGRLLRNVDEKSRRAELAVKDARQSGLYVPDASLTLERLRTARIKLTSDIHTLDLEKITDEVAAVEPIADDAHRLVSQARQERQVERRGYFAALALAGALFLLLLTKAAQLARRRSRSAP